jgi:dynein heavy chain
VFLLGPAGCGKTAIWKTLRHAQMELGEKTNFKPINPKAVTRNELYGYLHPSTREWKEGLMSVTFRNFANDTAPKHQWIVLDGDIDAEWIESMNTVMDDNKMLTLASNERIPLTSTMRLLLEINHMNHCSPATVSRGGVIFVNAEDVGWRPAVDSWMDNLEVSEYKPLLSALFDKYAEPCMEYCRRNFKYVVQLPSVAQAQIVCKILDGILPKEQVCFRPNKLRQRSRSLCLQRAGWLPRFCNKSVVPDWGHALVAHRECSCYSCTPAGSPPRSRRKHPFA